MEQPSDDKIPGNETDPPTSGGFMQFYGLYWSKEYVFTSDCLLPGLPVGWTGRGTRNIDRDTLWMNLWGQKGIYVLYNSDLTPVYTGQAGLVREKAKNKGGGRVLGERLAEHMRGKYRNGWSFFSWFGFLDCEEENRIKGKLKSTDVDDRRNVTWTFRGAGGHREAELNLLLDSFEAILIEAFVPRFNSRGGNLKDATYVDQFESIPRFMQKDDKVIL